MIEAPRGTLIHHYGVNKNDQHLFHNVVGNLLGYALDAVQTPGGIVCGVSIPGRINPRTGFPYSAADVTLANASGNCTPLNLFGLDNADPAAIEDLAALLAGAKNPVIITEEAGRSTVVVERLVELAELLGAGGVTRPDALEQGGRDLAPLLEALVARPGVAQLPEDGIEPPLRLRDEVCHVPSLGIG